MNKPHLEQINTAFLQLSFAIKLWNFLDVHPIEKENFDIALTILDDANRVCLPHNEFQNYNDIKLASENNISICFGVAANTLWEAICENNGFVPGTLQPDESQGENLAALAYMIRCCFAHGPAAPVWTIRNQKYKTEYRVGNKVVDLSNIADGTRLF